MYRRTGIVAFIVLGLWAAFLLPREVTYERGKSIDYSEGKVETVYTECGQAIPILFDGEFGEGVPSTAFHMQETCTKAARSRLAVVGMMGVAALAFLIVGLIRGPAPKVPPIDSVLQRLPTSAGSSG